jgi:hypothetical protein
VGGAQLYIFGNHFRSTRLLTKTEATLITISVYTDQDWVTGMMRLPS